MILKQHVWCVMFSLVVLFSCSTKVEVNAPSKDILVVYGVLDVAADTNFIRISKAFLTTGDAIQYAASNDLSLKNSVVTLTATGNNPEVITLLPDTIHPKVAGTFASTQTVYYTTHRLTPGKTYYLSVTSADNPNLWVKAHTTIPDTPSITNPLPPYPTSSGFDTVNDIAAIEKAYFVRFNRSNARSNKRPGRAFEMRAHFTYGQYRGPGDTLWFNPITFGPTKPFNESNCDKMTSELCVQLPEKALTQLVVANQPANGSNFIYDNSKRTKALRFEITAIDTFLYNYIYINNPAFVDFTGVRPEYSNIENGLGVLGSRTSAFREASTTPCSEYLMNLNNTPKPEGCKE